MVSSIERSHCTQDSQLCPNGVLYREGSLCMFSAGLFMHRHKTLAGSCLSVSPHIVVLCVPLWVPFCSLVGSCHMCRGAKICSIELSLPLTPTLIHTVMRFIVASPLPMCHDQSLVSVCAAHPRTVLLCRCLLCPLSEVHSFVHHEGCLAP